MSVATQLKSLGWFFSFTVVLSHSAFESHVKLDDPRPVGTKAHATAKYNRLSIATFENTFFLFRSMRAVCTIVLILPREYIRGRRTFFGRPTEAIRVPHQPAIGCRQGSQRSGRLLEAEVGAYFVTTTMPEKRSVDSSVGTAIPLP